MSNFIVFAVKKWVTPSLIFGFGKLFYTNLKERQSTPNTGIGILQGRNAVSITNQSLLGDLGLQCDFLLQRDTPNSHFLRLRTGYRFGFRCERAWSSVAYRLSKSL